METTKDLEKYTYDLLAERGVTLDDIAELVFYVQKPYMPNLKIEECREHVEFKTGRVSHKCGFCTI